MDILVLGAGMMGRAIAYDLSKYSNFRNITLADKDTKTIISAKKFLGKKDINFDVLDIEKKGDVKKHFKKNDVVISAVPYVYNYDLTKTAISNNTHFLDLGGNNNIVNKQRNLFKKAEQNKLTILPDCGLAPGLTSVIVRDIALSFDYVDYVKIRVGGLPVNPKPPFNYQIVFSPNGLINEYMEDAIALDHGKIIIKKPMAELEKISFSKPFHNLEAFSTSGGCSTLPYTFKNKISYLDYKTIRYPGHCEKMKLLLDLGLGSEEPLKIGNQTITPRKVLIKSLLELIPTKGKDVVLIKVISKAIKNKKSYNLEYTVIDYCDEKNNITAMMRTTAYPVSITAQMIENGYIKKYGVFGSEEIVPTEIFFNELKKRNIIIEKEKRKE